jgi:hypothetical protein
MLRAQNVSRRQIRAHRSRSSIPRRMPMWRRSRLRRHGWWMSACCSPRMQQKRLPPRKPAHLPGLRRSQARASGDAGLPAIQHAERLSVLRPTSATTRLSGHGISRDGPPTRNTNIDILPPSMQRYSRIALPRLHAARSERAHHGARPPPKADVPKKSVFDLITDQTDDVRSSRVKRTLRLRVQASFLAKAYSHKLKPGPLYSSHLHNGPA